MLWARAALCLPLLLLTAPAHKAQAIQDSRCYLMNGGAVESFFISEDTPVGSIIGTLSVNGDPSEEAGDISLSIQEKSPAVGLAPGSKNVTLLRALDREERLGPSNVYVNVRCDRRRTSDPSFIIPVSVRVWDVNDNAPVWLHAPYHVRVSELAPLGARLAAPRALDADQPGPHATIHYSVVPGPHSELVKFAHELESVVVVGAALDYERLRNFSVVLRARDAGAPPRHADALLHVELLDADDQNPAFQYEHYSAVIPEDAIPGTVLHTSPGPVLAADQDLGINAPVQYAAAGEGAALVRVARDTGALHATEGLLRATQPVTIVLKATQVDNPDRYALATLTVSRAAPSPPPPSPPPPGGRTGAPGGVRFSSRHFHVQVSEAAAPGALLTTLHTLPEDHKPLQFFVSERSFLEKFAINSAGEVLLRRGLDYEAADHYSYQVMVTDGTANDTASLNISVLDENEWEPRFRYPLYEFSLEASALDEGATGAAGGLLRVGRLEVFDGDRADTVTLSLSGPDASMMVVEPSGDVYVVAEALRFNRSVLVAEARAADAGRPPRRAAVPLRVHLPAPRPAAPRPAPALVAAAAAALLLAAAVTGALLYVRRRRRAKPSPAPLPPSPYRREEKRAASPPATPPPSPPGPGGGGGGGGSLQSVSAGASTILANSSSSLDLGDSLPHAHTNGGGARGRRVAPLPVSGGAGAGATQMSDHLAGAAGRSGVAWPAATIPARVKKLSWDDATEPRDQDSAVEASNTARHDHMNLTVYF